MAASGPTRVAHASISGRDTQILPNDVPVSEIREIDGLILSGGAAREPYREVRNYAEYLSLEVPILGYALATNSWLDTMEGMQERLLSQSSVQQPFP